MCIRDSSWSGDKVDICWDNNEVTKIEATAYYYYQEGGDFKAKRYYDGPTTGVSCGEDFSQGLEVPVPLGIKFINVRFYEDVGQVKFSAAPNLPAQGTTIVSQGQVADVSRRLQVVRGWPELPDFFDFVLFSGGSLAK